MKEFNTTAVCIPEKHYMVDLSERVAEIKKLVDAGKYFTINRARQYGKTTTIIALSKILQAEYEVVSLDFQGIDKDVYGTGGTFAQGLARLLLDKYEFEDLPIPEAALKELTDLNNMDQYQARMDILFRILKRWCRSSGKPVVLIVDEVDSAANNQVFLDFLAGLRIQYIDRLAKSTAAFHSVILAGVTDVKHLKRKLRPEEDSKVNSPWNIAADFDIDMSLSEEGIKGMLDDYETDHHTGMDTAVIAKSIREYTNGYPYLVSRICQLIDTKLVPQRFPSLSEAWTEYGVDEAVKFILQEDNAFFDSFMGKLINFPELKDQLQGLLLKGETVTYLPDDEEQKLLRMYGFIRNDHNTVVISNRIFEMRLYNYLIGESNRNRELRQLAAANKSLFITDDGWLDIPKIMEHFITEHKRIHGDDTEKFLEEEGRERFLTYLAPIINGTGTYSIEEQLRDHRRMDVVIHYLGRRYIIELKIWRGERYNADGEKQIAEYLDYWKLDTGYMLSFNFNQKKEQGVKCIQLGNKVLYEGTV